MNRRKLLKAFVAAPFIGVGGSAVAAVRDVPLPMAATTPNEMTFETEPTFFMDGSGDLHGLRKYEGGIDLTDKPVLAAKAEHYERKYWEAQAHIDMLYDELKKR